MKENDNKSDINKFSEDYCKSIINISIMRCVIYIVLLFIAAFTSSRLIHDKGLTFGVILFLILVGFLLIAIIFYVSNSILHAYTLGQLNDL